MNKFLAMDDEQKEEITCDELFCLYLRHMCKQVNSNFYRVVLRFILLYRSCLN
jgi:hypothetical protein